MPLGNTHTDYGALTKTLHWLTALLILTALPLGFLAEQAPQATGTEIAQKAWLFSLHKTVGVAAFLVALLRILWALGQTRPGLLNGAHRLEAMAAHSVHWLLYGSMLLVPLTGWLHHASTSGFAPILWPFGQSLPLVPKSQTLAELTSSLHFLFMLVLLGAILAHVAGALKHLIVDRDQTLQRMLPGRHRAGPAAAEPASRAPLAVALTIWALALTMGAGAGLLPTAKQGQTAVPLPEVSSDWQVTEGQLAISVHQFGSDVAGAFDSWTASIAYDASAGGGQQGAKLGHVEVDVAIASLTLGSVSQQALEADFLDAGQFPTARFSADIFAAEGAADTASISNSAPNTAQTTTRPHVARGNLTLRGLPVAVELPFDLSIDGDTATMIGETQLDRRDFGIGSALPDESSLGFAVRIGVALTATRAP